MRTLICIRQFPYAHNTIRFGSLFAQQENASITVMTVVDDDESIPSAEEKLEAAREEYNLPDATIKVRKGHVLKEILKESLANSYDRVVVGARAVEGFLDTFLGTVTGKVADQATMSVLVVREGSPKLSRILVSVGGQKLNRNLIEVGARLAEASGANVTALHVTAPVPSMYTGLDGMEETLEEMLQTDTPVAQHLRWSAQYLVDKGIDSEIQIRHGAVVDEILREAIKGDYDLIVLGASALEGPLRSLMVEKITPQVVDKAPCSVFVVKDKVEEE